MKKYLFSLLVALVLCLFVVPFSVKADTCNVSGSFISDNVVTGGDIAYRVVTLNADPTITYDSTVLKYVGVLEFDGGDPWYKVEDNNGKLTITITGEYHPQNPTFVVKFKTLKAGSTNITLGGCDTVGDKKISLSIKEPTCPTCSEIKECDECEKCEKCEECEECENSNVNKISLTTWISYGANALMLVCIGYMIYKLNKKVNTTT